MCSEVAGWIGDDAALVEWLERNNVGGVSNATNSSNGTGQNWDVAATDAYQHMLRDSGLTFAYLELAYDGQSIGRLLFQLFPELAPKTCENFLALCAKPKGGYVGTPIHRIKPGGWLQGGDVATGNGDGGASAAGEPLPDESFSIKHTEHGILGMANAGAPHTAQSQFYVTFAPVRVRAAHSHRRLARARLARSARCSRAHTHPRGLLTPRRAPRRLAELRQQLLCLRQARRRHETPALPRVGRHGQRPAARRAEDRRGGLGGGRGVVAGAGRGLGGDARPGAPPQPPGAQGVAGAEGGGHARAGSEARPGGAAREARAAGGGGEDAGHQPRPQVEVQGQEGGRGRVRPMGRAVLQAGCACVRDGGRGRREVRRYRCVRSRAVRS